MIVKDESGKVMESYDLGIGRLVFSGERTIIETEPVPEIAPVYQIKKTGVNGAGDPIFATVCVKAGVPGKPATRTAEMIMTFIPFTAEELEEKAKQIVPTLEQLYDQIRINSRAIIELADPNHVASEESSVSQLISDAVESGEKKLEEVGSKWKDAVSGLLKR